MNTRPLSITIISWVFIATGGITFIAGLLPFVGRVTATREALPEPGSLDTPEFVLVMVIRLLAVTGGFFMLLGYNRARWLLVAWMGYHVILSIFNSLIELVVHCLIFAVILYFLYRPVASAYFDSKKAVRNTRNPSEQVKRRH